jgi:ribA/ribD-fused uncharacterized protein
MKPKRAALDPPLNVPELLRRIGAGWSPKYVFFWGHKDKSGAPAGKHVLSQWRPSEFEIDGVRYPTAEHYMMAEKARLFGDQRALERILAAPGPGAAKAIGRQVRNFSSERWDAACFDIVARGNIAKFGQNPLLHDYLFETGDKVLVEASPIDRIWGIGLAADDPQAQNPAGWRGANLLGFALMKARAALWAEARP